MNKIHIPENKMMFVEPDFEQYDKMLKEGFYLLPDSITGVHNGIDIPFMGNSSHKVFASEVEGMKKSGRIQIIVKPHRTIKSMNNEIRALRKIREINNPLLPSIKLVGGMYLDQPDKRKETGKPVGYLFLEKESLAHSLDTFNINNLNNNQRRDFLASIGQHIARMHSIAKIYHGDLRAKNILVKYEHHFNKDTNKSEYPRLYLMDMENANIGNLSEKSKISDISCLALDLSRRLKIRQGVFVNQICVPYEEERKKIEGNDYHPIDWFKVFQVDYRFKNPNT